MLSPEYLTNVADPLLKVYEQIEDEILIDIAKKINKNLDVSYETEMWLYGGRDYNELKKKLKPYFKDIDRRLDLLVEDSIKKHYLDEQNIYSMIDKSLMPFVKNKAVLKQIELYQQAMKKQLHSIANTMGVAVNDEFVPLNKLYKHELNKAIVSTQSGIVDKTKAVRRVINNISRGGVKIINYENSGRNYTIESAVSMNIRSSLNRLSGEISLMNAKEMEHDLMEITAHLGARLSHSAWQGQVVSLSGENTKYLTLEDIGYGEVTGFMGANCKHNWYPFFEGLSSPYSSDFLDELQNKKVNYNGKEYSYYEATQVQRRMERDIRNLKKRVMMYDAVGDKEMHIIESFKLKNKRDDYYKFSNTVGINKRLENLHKFGYNKSVSARSVWARNNFEPNKIKYRKGITGEKYSKALTQAKKTLPNNIKWRVTQDYSIAEYDKMKLYVTRKGSTFAIKNNGDIVSVAKNMNDNVRGKELIEQAVKFGGTKLDSYDGNYGFYLKCGFEPVSWTKFNEEFAPTDWRKGIDKPEDIIFFKYTGKKSNNFESLEDFKKRVKPNDYDVSEKIRDKSMIKEKNGKLKNIIDDSDKK